MANGQEWMFWLMAAALTLAVALLMLIGVRKGAHAATPAAGYDLRVYRDQLSEVDRDLARGTLSQTEADRLRTEISRRVLEADRALASHHADTAAKPRPLALMLGLSGLLATAFWGYLQLGAPGYPDMPLSARIALANELRASRPSQAMAEADTPAAAPAAKVDAQYQELLERLRQAVAARPDDLQGQMLLARNEARVGNFIAAYTAQAQAIALKDPGISAEDYAALAELKILATGGYVSPEAEADLTESLRRDPKNGTARYYSGLMLAQTGRPDLAFRIWEGLLADSAETDPWVPALRGQIEGLAAVAGVKYSLPATAAPGPDAGPDAAQIAAAATMTEAERSEMVRGMVTQLSDRLASTGGTADEWARLIGALGVLGETDRAARIYAEAQSRFTGKTAELAQLLAAAKAAGVAP